MGAHFFLGLTFILCIIGNVAFAQDGFGRGSVVPAELFSLNVMNQTDVVYPNLQFKGRRLWDDSVTWADIEKSPGVYSWGTLDTLVRDSLTHGQDLLYVFGYVPTFHSSNPNLPECPLSSSTYGCCSGGIGYCAPPGDYSNISKCSNQNNPIKCFDDFVTALATRYKGKIKYYEGWDEPHNPWYWWWKSAPGDTIQNLITLNEHAIKIIKSIDPDAKILSPSGRYIYTYANGMSFMDFYFSQGGPTNIDMVSCHLYPDSGKGAEDFIYKIDAMKAVLLKHSLQEKTIYSTEGGWGKDISYPDPDLEAAFIARAYLVLLSEGISRFYWYSWGNSGWGTMWSPYGQNNCSQKEGCLNLAGIAYKEVESWIVGSRIILPCSPASANNPVWTCSFGLPSGINAMILWDTDETCINGVCTKNSYYVGDQYVDYRTLSGSTYPVKNGRVPVGAKPIFLLGVAPSY